MYLYTQCDPGPTLFDSMEYCMISSNVRTVDAVFAAALGATTALTVGIGITHGYRAIGSAMILAV